MKKAIIGGFLTLAGVIGSGLLLILTGLHPAEEWTTPPGRILTTMIENGTLIPAILFFYPAGYWTVYSDQRISLIQIKRRKAVLLIDRIDKTASFFAYFRPR